MHNLNVSEDERSRYLAASVSEEFILDEIDKWASADLDQYIEEQLFPLMELDADGEPIDNLNHFSSDFGGYAEYVNYTQVCFNLISLSSCEKMAITYDLYVE